MGCLFIIVLAVIATTLISLFGYSLWVIVTLGLLWLTALVTSGLFGHHGFGGHGNTDLQTVIAGLAISAAIIIPNYNAQRPCNQVKMTLLKLVDAENKYFFERKTFTTELNLLNLRQNPNVYIIIRKADEQSFIATASHRLCIKDKNGMSDVFIWDSAKGGLQ
jgi:hypothetical protein